MAGLLFTLLVYIVGGLTFLPLLVACVFLHAHLTFPHRDDATDTRAENDLLQSADDSEAIKAASAELEEKFKVRGVQDNDVSSGYFAVSREYVPGGVGAKPPERTTPAGSTTISSPSPSVYQSMYRSLFDRKSSVSPIENKGAVRPTKKGGNIFYIVLRHGHLMLFDDDEQLEVRYVISLAHHDVSIYGGGEQIPDGELFIKRNALCLSRKTDVGELTPDGIPSKPFFLFSENTSDKEDFYFAMLKNQERKPESKSKPPVPLQFEVKHIIGLVQRLHSSEEHLQTRWINALIGRIFLGLYKTTDVENFLRAKITKKISRVKVPGFLSKITLRSIDLGESAPFLTNPRLKDLTVDGDCNVEMDLKYTGNVRIEIAATARIELGTRFKAREVNLVLAVVLKKIEGHMQFRVKPPPSNRIWYTFTSMPKIEMSVEPIVSSRQITYTLILRQIENRIKEVIAESVVLPFWDDTAFFSTEGKKWRGGVWVDDTVSHLPHNIQDALAEEGDVDEVEHLEGDSSAALDIEPVERSYTTPPEFSPHGLGVFARKSGAKSVFNLGGATPKPVGISSGIEAAKSASADKPRSMRIGSFSSSTSAPVAATDNTNADAFKTSTPPDYSHAAAAMAAISAKSQATTPVGSPSKNSLMESKIKLGSFSSVESKDSDEKDLGRDGYSTSLTRDPSDEHILESSSSSPSNSLKSKTSVADTTDLKSLDHSSTSLGVNSTTAGDANLVNNKRATLSAMASAAQSAKKWGLDALAARRAAQLAAKEAAAETAAKDLSQPMGRGRPLPPPGTPLPPPDRKTKTAPIPVPKRRPLQLPSSQQIDDAEMAISTSNRKNLAVPALPGRRSQPPVKDNYESDGVFVVEAPDSEPVTPVVERREPTYRRPTVDDAEDVDAPPVESSGAPPVPLHGVKMDAPPKLPARSRPQSPLGKEAPSLPQRTAKESISSSPSERTNHLPSWVTAQEAENRAKNLWVDDDSGNLQQ